MTRCFRPRSPLRICLLILGILVAAAAPAIATYAATAQDSPSLMEICDGSHDPIALDDREGAEGELRFTIIATEDKTDETATTVAEPEQRFRRWGVGWHGDPGIRFRSHGGWYFTLRGRVEPYTDEESWVRHGNSWWYSNGQDYDKEERTTRFICCSVSRQFALWRGLSLGPVLELSHSYTRTELQSQGMDIYEEEQTYSLSTMSQLHRRETYGIELGIMPVWTHGSRISLETRFGIHYTRSFSQTIRAYTELNTDGSHSEGGYEYSYTDNGFDFDNKSFSTDMALGLYFYF